MSSVVTKLCVILFSHNREVGNQLKGASMDNEDVTQDCPCGCGDTVLYATGDNWGGDCE